MGGDMGRSRGRVNHNQDTLCDEKNQSSIKGKNPNINNLMGWVDPETINQHVQKYIYTSCPMVILFLIRKHW